MASGGNEQASRYLFSILERFYFWTPASSELLYVTQSYKLRGILKRIHGNSIELRTKNLESLSHWNSQHQIAYLPLWFWQIPKGWSQNSKGLKETKELLYDGLEYGIPLPVPILVDNQGLVHFMRCGDRYYLYCFISGDSHRIEEPTEFKEILRILASTYCEGLKLTQCDYLPEYGGPDIVPDEEVPPDWTKRVDQDACKNDFFGRYDIRYPSPLLFREADRGLPALYLVRGCSSQFYIWDVVSSSISKIEQPDTLQDILDVLKGSPGEFTLSHVEPKCRSERIN